MTHLLGPERGQEFWNTPTFVCRVFLGEYVRKALRSGDPSANLVPPEGLEFRHEKEDILPSFWFVGFAAVIRSTARGDGVRGRRRTAAGVEDRGEWRSFLS